MSRAYRSKAQWQALIDEFEQSGLSRKAFCEARGINPDYFSQRRRQLHQETESTGDLSPKNRTMTSMRFPLKWVKWRSRYEKTLQRRANHQGHQRA
ncbi:IS66 family insertion sequence element accessory protein TnpA [Idiomarina piscisalsi]|uniref:IS66 family insertion sequence element accessory protein TnpA n=1 Tax=Idiomarina piscisalsi TaxID=1096243 RepID=UPI000F871525|nr:hypothetical protein [Idiomarina piscisalsi]